MKHWNRLMNFLRKPPTLQEEAKKKLRMARETLGNFYQNASNQSKEIADGINACVHENPWRAVGIAAAAGVLLGLLIAKK